MIKPNQPILFSAVMILLLLTVSLANSGDVVLVINDSVGDVSLLTAKEVKRIYLGKTKKFNGAKVKPVGLSDGDPVRDAFNAEVLGMDADALKSHWIKESLKGGARPPKSLKSSGSLISYVKRKKGAIGYLSADDAARSGLTIVKLD